MPYGQPQQQGPHFSSFLQQVLKQLTESRTSVQRSALPTNQREILKQGFIIV